MNQLDKYQQLFAITAEEAGELTQACMKILRRGSIDDDVRQTLVEEVGDILCMVNLLYDYDIIEQDEIDMRIAVKRGKLKVWSDLFNKGDEK